MTLTEKDIPYLKTIVNVYGKNSPLHRAALAKLAELEPKMNNNFDPILATRHPSTQHMMEMLTPNPNLPDGLPAQISTKFHHLAVDLASSLEDGPELTAGLRKLLEAKDCFVRSAVFGKTVDYRDR